MECPGDWHPLFCEALQKTDYVERLLDVLPSGSLEERTAIVKEIQTFGFPGTLFP